MKTLMLACAAAALATGASAATLNYDFSTPSGDRGTTQDYTSGGLTIHATAVGGGDLFGKTGGGDENGVGLTNDSSGENEIQFDHGFVQLDLSALDGKVTPSSLMFNMGSTTDGETWTVYGSDTSGSFNSLNVLASGSDENFHSLPGLGTWTFFDFVETGNKTADGATDTSDNVLVSSLTATTAGVPEPATWTMMLAGFFGLGAMIRRGRPTARALA